MTWSADHPLPEGKTTTKKKQGRGSLPEAETFSNKEHNIITAEEEHSLVRVRKNINGQGSAR